MKPIKIDHPEASTARGYDHPTVGEISDLPVIRDGDGSLCSRWKASFWERLRILWTGAVMSRQQPPVLVVAGPYPPESFRHPWASAEKCAESTELKTRT